VRRSDLPTVSDCVASCHVYRDAFSNQPLTAKSAMSSTGSKPSNRQYDKLYLHARREALVILAVWATCFAWVVPYCRLNGYYADADQVLGSLMFGMPGWVFWGIAVPWLAANVATLWFCFVYFSEDELGDVAQDADDRPSDESLTAPPRDGIPLPGEGNADG